MPGHIVLGLVTAAVTGVKARLAQHALRVAQLRARYQRQQFVLERRAGQTMVQRQHVPPPRAPSGNAWHECIVVAGRLLWKPASNATQGSADAGSAIRT